MLERMKKSISLAIVTLIMMATIAVPVAIAGENAKPIENEKNTVGCTGCANNNGSCGIAGNATELKGAEKDKVINLSLNDKEVQKLQEQLKNGGFIQKEAKAYKVPVTTKDSKVIDVPVVEIKFKSPNGDQEDKKIMFAQNPETGQAVVLLAGSTWDCINCAASLAICLGSCVACVVACASPVNWLLCLPCIAVCGGSCVLAYSQCYTCYYGHPP